MSGENKNYLISSQISILNLAFGSSFTRFSFHNLYQFCPMLSFNRMGTSYIQVT